MNKLLVVVSLFLCACVSKPPSSAVELPKEIQAPQSSPSVVHAPKALANGGKLIRNLYRSFWTPPTSDKSDIYVGLIRHQRSVGFQAGADMHINVYSENGHSQIFSPRGVIWQVEQAKLLRPAIIDYHAALDFRTGNTLPSDQYAFWQQRGYKVTWVGSPPMDDKPSNTSGRKILSAGHSRHESEARHMCRTISKKYFRSCKVVPRISLPPLVSGVLRAQNASFSQAFEGVLHLVSPNAPIRVYDVSIEPLAKHTAHQDYLGDVFVVPENTKRISLVHKSRFSDYLAQVVPAETFSQSPMDALKAQAVIARSYALRHIEKGTGANPFMICASTMCQVYKGIAVRTANSDQAVRESANIILQSQDGQVAQTFYHGMCGGHTDDRGLIFGGKTPAHLTGQSDAMVSTVPKPSDIKAFLQEPMQNYYCGNSRFAKEDRWRWQRDFDDPKLQKIARTLKIGTYIKKITATKRARSGRIIRLEVLGDKGKAVIHGELKIRQAFGGLRSSMATFTLEKDDHGLAYALQVKGGGYGHGVGLCQMGAIGRANEGQSFKQILQAYYPQSRLAKITHNVLP